MRRRDRSEGGEGGSMIGPLSRILGRVLAGMLMGAGLASDGQIMGLESDLAELIGVILWGVTEFAYALAKKRGWTT